MTPLPVPLLNLPSVTSIPSIAQVMSVLSGELSPTVLAQGIIPVAWTTDLNVSAWLATVKLVSFVLSVVLSFAFMVLLLKLRRLSFEAPSVIQTLTAPKPAAGGAMTARWNEITDHMNSAKEAEWKFAVIEADKLADMVLTRAGFPGDTMGDRMMNIKDGQLISLENLWEAHKIRNRLAHDVDYFLRYSEAKHAIGSYEKVLRELGAL